MNRRIADQDVREAALDPRKSLILQAPAGSGKTELLIQRYLALLSLVDNPEEIVAITFTRKAAGEMQGRILDALAMVENKVEPESIHQQQTFGLASNALARSREQGWDITAQPGRLRIQTIDSLCALITRHMPLLSRLGTQPETVEDASVLYDLAARRTLACIETEREFSQDLARLSSHLDHNLPYIKTLLIDMLKKRDQWIPHISRHPERESLEQSLGNLVEEKLEDVRKQISPEVAQELVVLLGYAVENLTADNPGHEMSACRDLAKLPMASAEDLDTWKAIASLLLTEQGAWRKQFTVKNGFPPAGNGAGAEDRRQYKKRMEGVLEKLKKIHGMEQQLAEIKILPSARYADSEWDVVSALVRVLKLASAQLRLVFAEYNQVDFNEIALSALDALGTPDNPTDLAMHLDYRIRHILVDECQDISITQLRLLERLTAEWSGEEMRSLFLVGDPQQSIYRFREAEVGLFIELFENKMLGSIPLTARHLSVNFRSEPGIINWVNHSFEQVFPLTDITRGAVSYSPSVAFHEDRQQQHVHVYPAFGNNGANEADRIVKVIKDLRKQQGSDSIAVLVRSRAHLADIIPLFKRNRIRFRAIEIDSLATQPAIQDLLMLTRALLHPADRIAWLSVFRAPWCGLELDVMHALFNEKYRTIRDCLKQQDLGIHPHRAGRLNTVVSILEDALANRQRGTLRQLVEKTWCRLGGPATLVSEIDLDNVQTYFDLLQSLEVGGEIDDLQRFEQAVTDLFATGDSGADDLLQIMTIHKSKGLEFDHVILPGLGRTPRSASTELLAWLARHRESGDVDLILGPVKEAGQKEAPIYRYLAQLEREKQSYEDSRILYVATTRAKKSLHLYGHADPGEDRKTGEIYCKPASRSLLACIWPVVETEYIRNLPGSTGESNDDPGIELHNELRRLNKDWQLPQPDNQLQYVNHLTRFEPDTMEIEFEWAGDTIRHVGLVVHAFLQHMANQGIENFTTAQIARMQDQYRLQLRQAGVPEHELEWATAEVGTALTNIINDERGQWILSADRKDARNEYRLSGIYRGRITNVIIDRTFIDSEGIRWIIDYKTSRHTGTDLEKFLDQEEERYYPQLEKYAHMMHAREKNPVRLGLYFPLLRAWRELKISQSKQV